MANTPLGNLFAGLNNALDSRVAKTVGLRKLLEKATYSSAYYGIKIASRAGSVFKSTGKQKESARLKNAGSPGLFDLNLTEEQSMIRDAVRDFVQQKVWPNAEKCSEAGEIPEDILNGFNELGLSYYAIPENLGGMLTEKCTVTQMIIAEALAGGDLGMAHALLTPLGALNTIVRYGTAAQQERYVPAFIAEDGNMFATIAVNEPAALFDPHELDTKAVKKGDKYVLTGVKSILPLAGKASLFLVAADLENEGPRVFVVESSAKGISLSTDRSMGLNAAELGMLKLDNVEVGSDGIIVDQTEYEEFISLIRLSWSAMAVGTCHALLDYVIEYCNNREAFGEPITHRQSVAFMIADIKIELEGMRVLVQRAASRAEQGLDFSQQAYLASTFCSEKAMEISNNGVQLLGGYGYCRDYPVERWYRDLRAVALSYNGMHL